jgi:hypothetical protein
MKSFQDILKDKRDYYGDTEAAIEFAAQEWLRQLIPTNQEIKDHFTSLHYDDKNGHHYRENKDRIFGAK